MEFEGFLKIARLSREVIITEKIDGTNAQIYIPPKEPDYSRIVPLPGITENCPFLVGSRTRWITSENDNHGFAKWCYDHKDEMLKLGPGRHFGEWWGQGINRGYGLPKGEKRFSMFNVIRWCLHGTEPQRIITGDTTTVKMQEVLPECCGIVPILYRGIFDTDMINSVLVALSLSGSVASPGYMNPEGVVIYHIAGNVAFKKTLGNDGHKGGN